MEGVHLSRERCQARRILTGVSSALRTGLGLLALGESVQYFLRCLGRQVFLETRLELRNENDRVRDAHRNRH
jgi:hypothetical protein